MLIGGLLPWAAKRDAQPDGPIDFDAAARGMGAQVRQSPGLARVTRRRHAQYTREPEALPAEARSRPLRALAVAARVALACEHRIRPGHVRN